MLQIYQRIAKMLANGESGVLVTVLQSTPDFKSFLGKHWLWRKQDQQIDSDQTDKVIDKMTRIEKEMGKICLEVVQKNKCMRQQLQLDDQWLDLFLEPLLPNPRLIILGCGHVGQALAKMASFVNFPLVTVDDRPDFANVRLFPDGTQVICADFSQALDQIQLTKNDYLVIVTRGHKSDRLCLEKVAGKELAYIGMIGSRRRIKGLFAELIQDGVEPKWLEKVHSPIGLDIGAETPEEIGVSILAEMIQVRRKGEVL